MGEAALPGLLSRGQQALLCGFLVIGALVTAAPALHQLLQGWPRVHIGIPREAPREAPCPTPQPPPLLPPARPRPVPDPLRLTWEPVLTKEERRRGLTYYGSGRRLDRFAAKLAAGKPVTMVVLGGSVTAGGGSTNLQLSYANRFFKLLAARFPHSEHQFLNKAAAAGTTFYFAPCVRYVVPPDVDVIVLEFDVNDDTSARMTSTARRSYEQLLRQLLDTQAFPGAPAILQLHHYAWWQAQADGADAGLFYFRPEQDLLAFAHYYDLPAVSLRSATWHLQSLNILKVDEVQNPQAQRMVPDPGGGVAPNGEPLWVTQPLPAAAPNATASCFYYDTLHPSDMGHAALAELLAEVVGRALRQAAMGEGPDEGERRRDVRLEALPPPMIPNTYNGPPGFCAMKDDFEAAAVAQSGFEYAPLNPEVGTDRSRSTWGWGSAKPGAWIELALDTRNPAAPGVGSETRLWIARLQSNVGTGVGILECTRNCECAPQLLDCTFNLPMTFFAFKRFRVSQHRRCVVRITVTDVFPGEFPDGSGGHKVAVAAAMVTHGPLPGTTTFASTMPH